MKRHLTYLLLLLVSTSAYSQQQNEGNQANGQAAAAKSYFGTAESAACIYNSKLEAPYSPGIKGQPYFVSSSHELGTVSYDGITYTNILLRLDTYKNQLVALSPNGRFNVILHQSKADSASLHGYHIINFSGDSNKNSPAPGYYCRLYRGSHTILKKVSSSLSEQTNVNTLKVERQFKQSTTYYILKDNTYHTVKSKRALIKLFKTHRKELNSFYRQNKSLNFKTDPENTIVAIVRHYEILNQP